MCHTSYCGELALIQILCEDLFTEIRFLVRGIAMTSISSQSNYERARKWFPGIHVNSQEICTKVGKGGGAIMKIFGKPHRTDRCLHRKILFNFPKQFCFDPHHQSHNICEIHDSVIKLSILIFRLTGPVEETHNCDAIAILAMQV